MTSSQRVRAVLQGRLPDRPPVSFWCHFGAQQVYGPAAVEAHVRQIQDYDLDFLKIMNDNGYPHAAPVVTVADLAALGPLRGDEPNFVRQLQLIADLRRRLGPDVPMISTIFNSLAVLRQLIRPAKGHAPPQMDGLSDGPAILIRDLVKQNASAVRKALDVIGGNLAAFAKRCIEAGADGIYLSVRDDWVEPTPKERGQYDQLVRQSDLAIVAGASAGRFNLLHACGQPIDLWAFGAYAMHALNWADRAAGPSIAEVARWAKPTICAGVDNQVTLPTGSVADCENQVADALCQAGSRPIMICAGCTYDPGRVPRANLEAVVRVAKGHRYAA